MKDIPTICPECDGELEYISDVHLLANTDPQEAGLIGNCTKCGSMVYSQFKIYQIESTLFDDNGYEIETKVVNNMQMDFIRKGLKKYFDYSDEKVDQIRTMPDTSMDKLESHIKDAEKDNSKLKKKVDDIFKKNPALAKKRLLGEPSKPNLKLKEYYMYEQGEVKRVEVDSNRKPKIVFMTDVKGWAWWIKSEYIKKYLSDEFDIEIKNLLTDNNVQLHNKVDQQKHDLYFSYGFSYIDFLNKVPKHKKICGVTAHRTKQQIFPKMKQAGHHHANSKMLLKELHDMGFKRAYYVPNGVNEDLFKPVKPLREDGDLVVGHVGKECPAKGQREFILPAIEATGCKSATNLRTFKDKLPHTEMPKIYNEMDVFVVASTEDGTPNPALEAAACGRPIISNAIGNMPEFIVDGWNGFIVPRKLNAYIEKIMYFRANRDELIRMGNNARKTVEEGWTWKIQAENYRRMFNDIIKRS